MEPGNKSVNDRRLLHKKIYKNARGRALPWKEAYRQRCMDRLRSSRSQLVDRFRSAGEIHEDPGAKAKIVQDIMEIEWTAMNQTNGYFNAKLLPMSQEECTGGDEDQSAMLMLMEEIQQELMNEEERLLCEILNYDAALLASQVAAQDSEEVICPVCQVTTCGDVYFVRVLKESAGGNMDSSPSCATVAGATSNVLTCSCGLALQGANLTLSTVKSSLENTVSHHGQSCMGKMSFTPTTDTQGTNVLSTCNMCDWMSFLL